MKKNYWKLLVVTLMVSTLHLSAQEYSSGAEDIDQVRNEVNNQ